LFFFVRVRMFVHNKIDINKEKKGGRGGKKLGAIM